jgi:hypothetical protein
MKQIPAGMTERKATATATAKATATATAGAGAKAGQRRGLSASLFLFYETAGNFYANFFA